MNTVIETPVKSGSNAILTANGVNLFYRDWGAGAPLLFLSGWTLDSGMWAYQMLPLVERGFRCIAFDRRGHGRSSDPGGGYDFDTLADDLAGVIEAMDLRDVTLIGHSFSAGEMVRYITRHGASRIARLVFVAPASIPFLLKTADNPNGVDDSAFEAMRRQLIHSFPDWIEANACAYFTPGTSRAVIDWTSRMMTQASLQAALELNRVMTSTDFRAELARIRIPALIIHGDRDASAPLELTGRPAANLIAGARLRVYEGGPHGLYFTHTERLNQDLIDFCRESQG
jgi:non-heme chloroperoxidase